MKKILTLIAVVLIAATSMAANYKHSIGIVGGSGLGAQYKVMVTDNFTIMDEFGYLGCFAAAGKNGYASAVFGAVDNLVLAYQGKAAEGQGILLDYYVGGQIRLGYHDAAIADEGFIGVGAAAGIEACMKNAPIAFSFDFRPGYACTVASAGGVTTAFHMFDWAFNLGVRYKF